MTLLCFLLDLRSISPQLLRDLKRSLLQLANLYAVTSGKGEKDRRKDGIPILPDRIGLCYVQRSRSASTSSELKVAYRPGERFSLRDFHHAVSNLPTDCFVPEVRDSMHSGTVDQDLSLTNLLSKEALYAWGGEDVLKKVIAIITSKIAKNEALQKSLMDAAERCVTVEFILLEQEASLQNDDPENLNGLINSLHEHENCALHKYIPDTPVLCGLVKRWSQELGNDIEEPLQAVFFFRNTIIGCTNQVSCNLFASSNQIIDGFTSCQTCRCHGHPTINSVNAKASRFSCPVTYRELVASDLVENSVKVGEQTILFLPSFEGSPKLQRVSAPITFNVLERTKLASLDEGVIIGTSYLVSPSACHELDTASDECDKTEMNTQIFQGLCAALFDLDQGLVCSSSCNTETMIDGDFQCFYLLQPSERGPMLLRRLAAAEEILPSPELGQSNNLVVPEGLKSSISASLLKVELRDYNPLQHERGFHAKLNWLVKESLQFGSIPPRRDTSPAQHQASILQQSSSIKLPEVEMPFDQKKDASNSCITDEWEQLLIVDELNDPCSSTSSNSRHNFQNPTLSQSRPLDDKTSRILERLEAPKQLKRKATSPSALSIAVGGNIKKPLLPLNPNTSQPLKLMKRKRNWNCSLCVRLACGTGYHNNVNSQDWFISVTNVAMGSTVNTVVL